MNNFKKELEKFMEARTVYSSEASKIHINLDQLSLGKQNKTNRKELLIQCPG